MSAVENLDFDPEDPQPELHEIHAGFAVRDLSSADWALRKIALSAKKLAEVAEYVEWEKSTLDRLLAAAREKHEDTASYFGGLLETWHRKRLEDDPKEKTVKLASGELILRKSPDSVRVIDPDAFVCEHGFDSPLVKVKATPDLAAVKQAVKDGEALAGVEKVDGEVRFSVKPAPITVAPPADVGF